MRKSTLLFTLLLCACISLCAQTTAPEKGGSTFTFRFSPGEDLFVLLGNEAELQRLHSLVDEYRQEIASGSIPVCVDGYCASLPTAKENLNTAFLRANRVKSELIVHKGLKEADFITKNYATAWQGRKDMVIVTLRIPATAKGDQPAPRAEQAPVKKDPAAAADDSSVAKPVQQPAPSAEKPSGQPATSDSATTTSTSSSSSSDKRCPIALRTNLLYDAFLLPTLGIEWRINSNVGIKFDGSLSRWGGKHGKVQKMWMLNPEVRWYLLCDKRFYLGASGNYGKYNIYEYMIGNLLRDDTGYQGKLWNAGLTVGYQLPLCRHLSVDFNLGLGYTRSEYDSFKMEKDVRIYKEPNRTKNIWGPTQAGISLVWTIGGNN